MEIAEMPRPQIGPGQVLVQTRACGICATDVKTYMRGHPLIPAGAVLGHEMSGIIVDSRAQDWCAGERVVVAPYVPCGKCIFCQRGQYTLCKNLFDTSVQPGGFSEFLCVPQAVVQSGLFRLPPSIDFEIASLAEPLACCYHGLEALNLRRGDSLLVIGDGPMGLLQTIAARAMGAAMIALAGMTSERLAWGAPRVDHVVNVSETNLGDAVNGLTSGKGFDKVMVSVGQAAVAEQALAYVARGGAVNFFAGLPRDARITIDPNKIHYDEVTIVGSFGSAPPHFKRAVETLTDPSLDMRGFITRSVPLPELESAFADSAAYRGIKMVAVFS